MYMNDSVIDINKEEIRLEHRNEKERAWNDGKGKIYKQNCYNYMSVSIIYVFMGVTRK